MSRFLIAAASALVVALLPSASVLADNQAPIVTVEELQALVNDDTTFATTDPNPTSPDISVSFFVGAVGPLHPGAANWTNTASHDSDPYSMELDVPEGGDTSNFFSSFAGINFHHVTGRPAPMMAPTFDFMADKTAESGGSPRLVIVFSSPPNTSLSIDLRPLSWTSGQWVTEGSGPTLSDWDLMNNGVATCPQFLFERTYTDLMTFVNACDPGAVVTSAFIVTDSGWVPAPGGAPYTNWIDNIQFNGVTVSQPSSNS